MSEAPAHKPSSLKASVVDLAVITGFVSCYYILLNYNFVSHFGRSASGAPDLWFYVAVAKGYQTLSSWDPTFWLVRFWTQGADPVQAGELLTWLSCLLNLVSCLLIYVFVRKLTRLGRFASVLVSILFAALPHNAILARAAFTHFSVAQPLIIVGVGCLLPACLRMKPFSRVSLIVGLISMILACLVGPEGFFAAFILAFLGLTSNLKWSDAVGPSRGLAAGLILTACLLLHLAFPHLFDAWSILVQRIRGIDLKMQQQLACADLLPLGARYVLFFGGFYLIFPLLGVLAWWRGYWRVSLLLVLSILLTVLLVRFYYTLELMGFAALILLLESKWKTASFRRYMPVALLSWLVLVPFLSEPVCYSNAALVDAATEARKRGIRTVASSPNLGFFFQAWGFKVTDHLHQPPGIWARIAASDFFAAQSHMREAGVDALVLTSQDFQLSPSGYWSTGGLGGELNKLGDRELSESVAYQAVGVGTISFFPLEAFYKNMQGRGSPQKVIGLHLPDSSLRKTGESNPQ
jgi:hypothetical protein